LATSATVDDTTSLAAPLAVASFDATPRLASTSARETQNPSMPPVAESLAVGEPRALQASPPAHLVNSRDGVRHGHMWSWVRPADNTSVS
jgi:hypothetical protein